MNRHFTLLMTAFILALGLIILGYERKQSEVIPTVKENVSSESLQKELESFSLNEASEVAKFTSCTSDCEEIKKKVYSKLSELEVLAEKSSCSVKNLYIKAAKNIFEKDILNKDLSLKQKDPSFPNQINKLEFNLKKLSKVDC